MEDYNKNDMEPVLDVDISKPNVNFERAKAIATIEITAAVNVANVLGYAVDADPWINAVLSVISVAAIAYSWWFNQNITPEAAQAQIMLDALKTEAKNAKHAAKAEPEAKE